MPLRQLGAYEPDGVVCRGMGRNALARLSSAGITVFITRSQTVGEVIEEARDGRLQPLDAAHVCTGHEGAIK